MMDVLKFAGRNLDEFSTFYDGSKLSSFDEPESLPCELIDFLSSTEGYQRLETSKEPDVYRMAQFTSAVEPQTGSFLKYGNFELVFNCMPQVFLKEGELELSITDGKKLKNPTNKTANPLFIVEGTGTITIGNYGFSLNQNTGETYIDCEIQDAYEGSINRNGNLVLLNGFPRLEKGYNTINISGFTSVKIVPRWWRL